MHHDVITTLRLLEDNEQILIGEDDLSRTRVDRDELTFVAREICANRLHQIKLSRLLQLDQWGLLLPTGVRTEHSVTTRAAVLPAAPSCGSGMSSASEPSSLLPRPFQAAILVAIGVPPPRISTPPPPARPVRSPRVSYD